MKTLFVLLVCALAGAQAMAAAQGRGGSTTICPGFKDLAEPEWQLARVAGPIHHAIRELDHALLELPSTVLATGKLTYLSISEDLPDQLDKVRVLGYFEVPHGDAPCLIPLTVNHVESGNGKSGTLDAKPTRIHFHVPEIDRFADTFAVYQQLTLRIAAFAYDNGEFGHVYFGRKITLHTSSRSASIGAALLFAFGCYILSAQAVASAGAGPGAQRPGWRAALDRLAPWNLVGEGAQTALAQLQMLMFTLVVATLLFYQWMRTGVLQELSTDLLYLIGISTLGAAGSQVGSAMKKGLDPAMYRYAQQLDWFTAPLAQACKRADPAGLLTTNQRIDIYKFQMLVFSIVIAAYVIGAGADHLDQLTISATLLTLMGISQGAYVGGNVTSDSMTVLQDQLRGMHKLQQRYRNSGDAAVRAELRRRFRLAAGRAAAPFGTLYGRAIPDYLLEMPIDADAAPLPDADDQADDVLRPDAGPAAV